MGQNEQDIGLLTKAIESINSVSSTLMQYYQSLEDKVKVLTDEVDQKKQLLDSILDSIDVGVVFFDKDGVIRLINKAAEGLLCVKSDEITGGVSLHAEIRDDMIVPEESKPFPAIISDSEVCAAAGRVIGRVLIFNNITMLKRLEAENERNRRLSAMGELVMKIAHEIRNPLGSIELFANLLANDLKGTEQVDYARRISNSVRSLVSALDNMLRFSGEIRPKMEYSCINDVVRETCDEFREVLTAGGIEIDLTEDGRYSFHIDQGLVRQALINIILNAVQAMQDGGRITLRIEQDAALKDRPQNVRILIRDNGSGMDEETKARLFEPFFSTKDRGTGLGMSITQGIIAAHKGSIEVESAAGKGTEFVISLPTEKRTDKRGK
ncbi:MAG TPA: ATP-binding protein [Dissulfurispiraceae bacterium]|nr:ATP-binding protein [Dissulfurispiraceae bacterium]